MKNGGQNESVAFIILFSVVVELKILKYVESNYSYF